MDFNNADDTVTQRVKALAKRVAEAKDADLYYYNQPVSELRGGARVIVNGREMGMFASYSYLGLVGHPRTWGGRVHTPPGRTTSTRMRTTNATASRRPVST